MEEILHQLRLVGYPINYKVLSPSKRWLFGSSEPSTAMLVSGSVFKGFLLSTAARQSCWRLCFANHCLLAKPLGKPKLDIGAVLGGKISWKKHENLYGIHMKFPCMTLSWQGRKNTGPTLITHKIPNQLRTFQIAYLRFMVDFFPIFKRG